MANFDLFYKILQPHEGGYLSAAMAKSIGDSGGETYMGVSRINNPNWPGWKLVDEEKTKKGGTLPWNYIIKNATLDKMVKDLAKTKYWDVLQADKLNNQSIANLMADFGFNSGPSRAANKAQEVLNLPQKGLATISDTIEAINKANQKKFFESYQEARVNFIKNSGGIKTSIKPQLVKRTESFFFQEIKQGS